MKEETNGRASRSCMLYASDGRGITVVQGGFFDFHVMSRVEQFVRRRTHRRTGRPGRGKRHVRKGVPGSIAERQTALLTFIEGNWYQRRFFQLGVAEWAVERQVTPLSCCKKSGCLEVQPKERHRWNGRSR